MYKHYLFVRVNGRRILKKELAHLVHPHTWNRTFTNTLQNSYSDLAIVFIGLIEKYPAILMRFGRPVSVEYKPAGFCFRMNYGE